MPAQTTTQNTKEGTLTQNANEVSGQPQTKVEPEKDIFAWKSASRPFKKRTKQFWLTTIAIAAMFGLVMFLAEGAMPVILIISIVFLVYVYSTVEPEVVEYKITNKGIKIQTASFEWPNLIRFWFTRRFDSDILVLETVTFPGRLEIVVNTKDKEIIKKSLLTYIPQEEVPPSKLDRAASWFATKMPGNQ